VLALVLATSAYGLEKKAVQMREDFGTEPLYDCYMNYYYYIPCPTYSWFWNFTGWPVGQVVGEWFQIGDVSMGRAGSGCPPYIACDPNLAHTIQQFRVLDFAGYGTVYPGLFTVEFNLWCADPYGSPIGAALWSSGPYELCAAGWNTVPVTPNLCVTNPCGLSYPRVLLTAKHIGTNAAYPAWGFDNLSTPITNACVMHDTGCCPALYPRPMVSHYTSMHSGDYGVNFAYSPPYWILNPGDSVGDVYGCIELAWRLYLINSGPTATEPSTWGNIKSMYR
jgi:hypothetical protein